jgi:predicted nucleotidyltransferase
MRAPRRLQIAPNFIAMTAIPAPIQRLLDPFVADLRATLGPDLFAVYLTGSSVAGDFDPDASDIDLIVATVSEPTERGIEPFQGLVQRLAAVDDEWADRLDVVFVAGETLRTFRTGGSLYAMSHEEPLERFDDVDDWVQTWFLLRVASVNVVGPAAADVIPPISLHDFQRAVAADARHNAGRIARDPEGSPNGYVAYVAITLCRILVTLETGDIVPKNAAISWVAAREPKAAALLERVRAVRNSRGRLSFAPDERQAVLEFIERHAALVDEARTRLEGAAPATG